MQVLKNISCQVVRTGPKRVYAQQNVQLRIGYPSILEETIVIQQILYFSDTARLEERFYIGFEKYLMLGRENGAKTCLRTITTRIMNTVRALTFEETIVIQQMLYFSDTARLEEHFYIGFEKYLILGRENGAKTCLRTTTTRIMNTASALTFEETIVIQQILYFSDTARLEERFYIGFEKYLMLGRVNGIETWVGTKSNQCKIYIVVERLHLSVKVFDQILKILKKISMPIRVLEETKKGFTIETPSI